MARRLRRLPGVLVSDSDRRDLAARHQLCRGDQWTKSGISARLRTCSFLPAAETMKGVGRFAATRRFQDSGVTSSISLCEGDSLRALGGQSIKDYVLERFSHVGNPFFPLGKLNSRPGNPKKPLKNPISDPPERNPPPGKSISDPGFPNLWYLYC